MSEPEASANDQDPRASQPQERSHDKVLVDAIGYTKGLVALLDSLTEGFQRRGRELDDQRARLAILQSERRTILQERAEADARITALTAERDGLRTALDTRERELGDLQQSTAHTQTALQARTREIEALRAGMAEPTRQAEELREVVRSLERQLHRAGQLPARAPLAPVSGESAPSAGGRTAPQLDAATFDERFSEQRRSEDGRIAALTAERDGLRGTLEEHEQEVNRLRQDVARGQAALEAQTREIQALRTGMAETVRQAEEIRKVLLALEGQLESAGRREAALEEALEAERRQVREAAVRASQEHDALREDLADAENLLAEARKDIGASQGVIASLRRTADEERAQGVALREQLEKQSADLVRLRATVEAVPTLLNEFVRAFGGGEVPPPQAPSVEDHEASWLEALAQAPAAAHPDAEVLAILHTVRDAFRDVVPPAAGSDVPPPNLATNPAELRRRADQIAGHWRRVVRKRGEPSRPAEPARQERGPVSEPGGPTAGDREVQSERAARPSPPAPPPAPAGPSSAGPKSVKRPGPPSGMTVECTFPASETEAACILRGEIARINDMGLLAAFEERLPEGVSMVVRFVRDGEVFSCLGRVVRVQESAGTSAASATLHHLIRFESPVSAAREHARSSAS